jgi:enoyl-CoA hydratase
LGAHAAVARAATLKLVKEQINHAQDAMGRKQAMDYAFALHQVGHLQNMLLHGFLIDTARLAPAVRARIEAQKAAGETTP